MTTKKIKKMIIIMMMKKMIVIMMTKTTMHHLEVGFDSGKMTGVSVPSPMAVSTGSVKRPPTPDRPADCAEWGGTYFLS